MSDAASRSQAPSPAIGVAEGVGAYLWWGVVTVFYFKWVSRSDPWELLAWRVLAGLPVLLGILAYRGDLASMRRALADRSTRRWLVVSTVLICANWFVFIVSVVRDRLTEASLLGGRDRDPRGR